MTHALTSYLGLGDFDTTLLTDYTAVLKAFVLAAQAFEILDRTEHLGAEQTVALGLEGTIINRFRFLHFTVGPGTNHVWRRQSDLDVVKVLVRTLFP